MFSMFVSQATGLSRIDQDFAESKKNRSAVQPVNSKWVWIWKVRSNTLKCDHALFIRLSGSMAFVIFFLRLCLVSEMACTGRAAVLDAAPSGTQKIILKIDLEDSWKSVRAWDSSADSKVAYEFENVKNMVLFVTHLYRDDKLRSMGLAQTCSYLVAWRRHVEDDVEFVDEPWKSCFRRDLQQETMQEKLSSLCDWYRYSVPRTVVSVPYFGFETWLEKTFLGFPTCGFQELFDLAVFLSATGQKKRDAILWTFTVHMSKCKISMPYQCETNSKSPVIIT